MKRTLIVISSILVISCGTSKMIPGFSEKDAKRASEKFPGTTLADLNQGKMNYEQNCAKCHGLKSPVDFSEESWRKIVPPMAKKARIDSKTEDLILRYVVTMSANS